MPAFSPILVDLKPSTLKFYFLIAVHCLAVLSVLLISDFGLLGLLLKTVCISLLVLSFKQYFFRRNEITRLHLKIDDLVDLSIGEQNYSDLQLSRESYISDVYMQLFFADDQNDVSYSISVFPDAIEAPMHSQLRSRLKVVSA